MEVAQQPICLELGPRNHADLLLTWHEVIVTFALVFLCGQLGVVCATVVFPGSVMKHLLSLILVRDRGVVLKWWDERRAK